MTEARLCKKIDEQCRDPMSAQETTHTTSIRDTLDLELRELYQAVKKRTKKEGEASYYQEAEDNGQLGPVHFL